MIEREDREIATETPRLAGVPLAPFDNEMAALTRARDWASTPLGPTEQWPQSLRTVVDVLLSSKFSMWMGWGPELTFFYNDAYRRDTIGVKHPWALGTPFRQVWAEIWPDLEPRIRTVLEKGEATWDEALLLFLERSGYAEETYHTFSYSPLRDDDGKVAGLLSVVAEVTERVIGERRLALLRDLASRLAATTGEVEVFESVRAALAGNPKDLPFTATYLFHERDGVVRLAAATGVSAGHAAAPAAIAFDAPDAPWPVAAVLSRQSSLIVDGLAARFEDLPTGAWDTPPHRAAVVPIAQRGHDTPAGFMVVGINPYRQYDASYAGFLDLIAGQIASSLANARAYEQERLRAQALAELDRAKTTFFSNVSHELRTPLTLLLGPLEDALRSGAAGDVREQLDLAHRNGLRLLKLVNSLLDFSRIEAGRVQALYEPTDLGAFTGELASSFRSACERAGLTLRVESAPLCEPVYVDADLWEKVVLNLLSNAFKHTFAGSITVLVREQAGVPELIVEDTGVGISPEHLPRIFERFHRVPSARSRTHEGTGIGLALVQEIVRRHGGDLHVESVENVGTRFTVRLRYGTDHLPRDQVKGADGQRTLASTATGAAAYVEEALRWLPDETLLGDDRAALETGAETSGISATPAPTSARGSARILLADDNADMRSYVARLLRTQGWVVDTVPNGAAALARVREARPDLVLSDIMMPELDGFGLIQALRADPATATLPIILLSARAGEEARVEGAQAGADDYLAKPFSAQELVARVGGQLSLARERARATAAIGAARDLLTRVLEQAPVGICVLRGPDLVFELANAHYRQFLPAERAIIGRPVREVVPEAEDAGYIGLLEHVLKTGEPWIGRAAELRYDRRGTGEKETIYLNLLYHPFSDFDGSIVGVLAVVAEITEEVLARRAAEEARRDAEEARRAAEEALRTAEGANRAKSDFLAVMSHELRTPLNAIGGYVELLELGIHGPVTDAQRDALQRVARSQRHLLGLINDVLNLARIETGKLDYALESLALDELVAELAAMIEPQLAARQLRYTVELETRPLPVLADREKLAQILLNLLSNAVKFTDPGGAIHLRACAGEGEMLRIDVSDTGVGIPHEKLDAIFEPFVQVRVGATRPSEGVGLGLAISRDLARGMGGELTVTSAPGAGSTFSLTLPQG